MGKKVPQEIVDQEAQRFRDLLKSRGIDNRSEFGSGLTPKRSRGEIHQHENGIRPIPLEAAKSYAEALKCTLRDISPRWADAIGENGSEASRKPSDNTRKLVRKLCIIAESIDDLGLMYLIGKAEEVAKNHPHQTKQKKGRVISMADWRVQSV